MAEIVGLRFKANLELKFSGFLRILSTLNLSSQVQVIENLHFQALNSNQVSSLRVGEQKSLETFFKTYLLDVQIFIQEARQA